MNQRKSNPNTCLTTFFFFFIYEIMSGLVGRMRGRENQPGGPARAGLWRQGVYSTVSHHSPRSVSHNSFYSNDLCLSIASLQLSRSVYIPPPPFSKPALFLSLSLTECCLYLSSFLFDTCLCLSYLPFRLILLLFRCHEDVSKELDA
jgi:hypothetical protein